MVKQMSKFPSDTKTQTIALTVISEYHVLLEENSGLRLPWMQHSCYVLSVLILWTSQKWHLTRFSFSFIN